MNTESTWLSFCEPLIPRTLTTPSPTHHQSGSWPGIFSWFCGWWTVFSSIFFLVYLSLSCWKASPKHVWAVALLENLMGAVKPRICSGAQCLAHIPRVLAGPGNIHPASSLTLRLLIPLSAMPLLYSAKWGLIGHVI